MNTPFDKFIERGGHRLNEPTVRDLILKLKELEQLGMADYKVLLFPDRNLDCTQPVTRLEFDNKSVIFDYEL